VGEQLEAGFTKGLEQVGGVIQDVSGAIESTLLNAFSAVEDAIVEFVRTGEFQIRRFVDSVIADLTRLIVRLAAQRIFIELLGSGAGGTAGAATNARQLGGPVTGGRPFLVGERGREIFVPPTSGFIVPNDQTEQILDRRPQQSAVTVTPAPVQTEVFIIDDESQVPRGIESPEGERAVLRVVRRNRQTSRRL
jgi:hypothetical protein